MYSCSLVNKQCGLNQFFLDEFPIIITILVFPMVCTLIKKIAFLSFTIFTFSDLQACKFHAHLY